MRLVSALLAVAMLFVMMPVGAFAAGNSNEDITVTVKSNQTLQEAVKEKLGDENYASVKKLTVITDPDDSNAMLKKDDFQFMSGTVVTESTNGRYAIDSNRATTYLSGLETLDLTNAVCAFTWDNKVKAVNVIPPRAFQASAIKTIYLPKNLEQIGLAAFFQMTNLEYLGTTEGSGHFPDTVKAIGESMANGDTNLKGTLVLPKNLEVIGGGCFSKTALDGEIVIGTAPNGKPITDNSDYTEILGITNEAATNIFGGAANNDGTVKADGAAITSLEFQNGINKVPDYTAMFCKSLKKVVIPSTVTEIGAVAFRGDTALSGTFVVPKSVALSGNMHFLMQVEFSKLLLKILKLHLRHPRSRRVAQKQIFILPRMTLYRNS